MVCYEYPEYGDIGMVNMQRGKIGQRQLDTLRGQLGIAEETLVDFVNYKYRAEFSAHNPWGVGVNGWGM